MIKNHRHVIVSTALPFSFSLSVWVLEFVKKYLADERCCVCDTVNS